jgi:transcriptional regulator with XRE-family HTH domain
MNNEEEWHMGKEDFASFFKRMRMRTGLTLRAFCAKHELDPGNMSKLERGVLPAPSSPERLKRYAGFLNIEEGSEEWYDFFDLAATSRGRIPADFMNDKELASRLPMVFRTLRGKKIAPEKLDELVELIRKA